MQLLQRIDLHIFVAWLRIWKSNRKCLPAAEEYVFDGSSTVECIALFRYKIVLVPDLSACLSLTHVGLRSLFRCC